MCLQDLTACDEAKKEVREGTMNSCQSGLRAGLIAAAFVTLVTQTSLAQQAPATTVRTVLALTSLPSVVDASLFFKLSKLELPAGQTTRYLGPVGFIYVLSGSLAVQTDAAQRLLQQDDAILVTAGTTHSLSASGAEAALFLHFVLGRLGELDQAAEQTPAAVVTELYRTSRPIPNLKPGRYEFTLTRASYQRMAANPPHYRSGAALYYVRSGSGIFIADGKSETKEWGTPHFEPYGWVHQWANDGEVPLVLLQANISEEGVPVVIMVQPPASPPGR
jgi:quercetin dioxygenase-like cupin family protein